MTKNEFKSLGVAKVLPLPQQSNLEPVLPGKRHSRLLGRLTSISHTLIELQDEIRLLPDEELYDVADVTSESVIDRLTANDPNLVCAEVLEFMLHSEVKYRTEYCDECGDRLMTPFEIAVFQRLPGNAEKIAKSLRVPVEYVVEAMDEMIEQGWINDALSA